MGQYSTTAILIAALFFWGVGMSIAIWMRFKHVGKQLTKRTSLLISGGIWLAIFLILISGDNYPGNTASAAIFLVALACYAILRMGERPSANELADKKRAVTEVETGGFENGMLLSVSLGVFIFASQFAGVDNSGTAGQMSVPTSNSQLTEDDIEDILNAAEKRKAAREQAEAPIDTYKQPAARASYPRAIRLEDGWNISLFHYDPGSDMVQIEAVTAEEPATDKLADNHILKPADNNWHQISNVKVVAYPDDIPATWIEVELSEDDINTLRFAAETGAISIYSN